MGVGVVWLGMAFLAFLNGGAGWDAGHSDLGFWWTVIATFLTIGGVGTVIGTWLHTQPVDD